jgi:hypothetical protein
MVDDPRPDDTSGDLKETQRALSTVCRHGAGALQVWTPAGEARPERLRGADLPNSGRVVTFTAPAAPFPDGYPSARRVQVTR